MANLTFPITDVAPLIPQSGQMVLLDTITAHGADFLTAETTLQANNILLQNGKFFAFSGVEIMAQGIAAWAGCNALLTGESIRLGYLLGTRKLNIYAQEIPIGTQLQIQIKLSIQDAAGFGVFDCQLINLKENKVVLAGALNVFSPKEGNKNE